MEKKHESVVERVRREVLSEFQRVDGEDYEEWMDFIQYEVNARLEEIRAQDLVEKTIRYD